MEDIIIIILLAAIAIGIICYLVRTKKRGEKCVGCPHAKQCGNCGGCGQSKKDK